MTVVALLAGVAGGMTGGAIVGRVVRKDMADLQAQLAAETKARVSAAAAARSVDGRGAGAEVAPPVTVPAGPEVVMPAVPIVGPREAVGSVDVGAATALAEQFELQHFSSGMNPASREELARAGLALAALAREFEAYLAAHTGVDNRLKNLQAVSEAMLADDGTAANRGDRLDTSFATTVQGLVALVSSIENRANETPESLAVTKQINAVAKVVQKHAKPVPAGTPPAPGGR